MARRVILSGHRFLEQRNRESPVLSGLVLYVRACDPKRRGRPSLPLLDWRRCRTAARRCPATRRSRGPRTTGFARRVGNGFVDPSGVSAFKEDVVAFRVAGVGIALQDQRFFAGLSHY